jgi:hypothetical protein
MKSVLSKADTQAEQIAERMCSVRNAGYDHVVALQGEAKRLVDWKEYVRAKPILFVAGASLLGFSLVRKATQLVSKSASPTMVVGDSTNDSKSFRSTLTGSMATFATSMASNAIKSYIVNMMQRVNSEGSSNDRFRNSSPTD